MSMILLQLYFTAAAVYIYQVYTYVYIIFYILIFSFFFFFPSPRACMHAPTHPPHPCFFFYFRYSPPILLCTAVDMPANTTTVRYYAIHPPHPVPHGYQKTNIFHHNNNTKWFHTIVVHWGSLFFFASTPFPFHRTQIYKLRQRGPTCFFLLPACII